MLPGRSRRYYQMGDPSGRLRLPLALIWTCSTPLLPAFIGSAGEWGGGECAGALMNDRSLWMKRRKYSEGRKDHWFVSESNGLSYASECHILHSSRCSVRVG